MIVQPAPTGLELRDIHVPPAPPWWPPAPGWWLLAALVLAAALFLGWRLWRRQRRRRALRQLFDATVAAAATPDERLAAVSALLRRAARARDPHAATLHGDDWLRALDAGAKVPLFAGTEGRLLVEAAWRGGVDAAAVDALLPRARQRYLEWMGAA